MLGRAGSWVGNAPAATTVGTLATMQATTGSQGQAFFNTTYNSYFDWLVDRWFPRVPDPRYGFLVYDEFMGSDRIGQLDWNSAATQIAGNLLNPGVYKISTSASASLAFMASQGNAIQLGTMDLYVEAGAAIPVLSNGSDNANYAFLLNDGFAFDTNSACTDGAYITVGSSNIVTTNTSSNSTNTQKVANATIVAGTFYRWGVYVNAGTSAAFTINGSSLTTAHSTNIPSGAGRQTSVNFRVDKNLGAGALTISMDYFLMYGFYNQARIT